MVSCMPDVARNWMIKALHDLATARKAAAPPDPYLDTAIYHCQQAAEKSVKAFLAAKDHKIEKTHDIQALVRQALQYESAFTNWFDAAELLSPFATEYRYPDDVMEPDADTYREAYLAAEKFLHFVLSLLPPNCRP